MTVVPSSLDFGDVAAGSGPQSRTVEVQGSALARHVSVQADEPVAAVVEEEGRVVVTLLAVRESFKGQVTITSPVGSVVLPIRANVSEARAPDEPVLVERRVTPVAPPAQPRQETASATASETATRERTTAETAPLSRRTRGFVSVASALGGLLVLASYAAPWTDSNMLYPMGPGFLTGLFILGIAGIVVGIAVTIDRGGRVSSGLALGVSLVAGNALLTAFGVMADAGIETLGAGWLLAAVGEVLIVAAGVACLVVVARSGVIHAAWPTHLARHHWAVLGLTLIGGLTLVAYTAAVTSDPPYPAIMMLWAVSYLAVGAVVVSTSPPAVSRAFLAGWALAALAQPLSDLAYLEYTGRQLPGIPLMAILIVVLVALVFVAAVMDRQAERPAG
jgi:hypothetical protein